MHESTDEHLLEHILADNDQLAQHNRKHFEELGICAINLMSAPGAGKTSLLEASIGMIPKQIRCGVIEGDMVGELDAERLKKAGVDAFQICTGRSCHLDAKMVARLLHTNTFDNYQFLFIENVGNLVCPAEFPLGEHKRVVLLSVTEGDDKPLKYPVIFRNCDLVIFTKCDLLPHVSFKLDSAIRHIEAINSRAKTLAVSATTGQGLNNWLNWLDEQRSFRVLPKAAASK